MNADEIGANRGIFGPKTEAAVRAFQTDSGVPATGAFDGATRAAMTQKSDQPVQILTEQPRPDALPVRRRVLASPPRRRSRLGPGGSMGGLASRGA